MSTPLPIASSGSPMTPSTKATPPSATPNNPIPIWLIVVVVLLLIGLAFSVGNKTNTESHGPVPTSSVPTPGPMPTATPGQPLLYSEKDLQDLRRLDKVEHNYDQQLEYRQGK